MGTTTWITATTWDYIHMLGRGRRSRSCWVQTRLGPVLVVCWCPGWNWQLPTWPGAKPGMPPGQVWLGNGMNGPSFWIPTSNGVPQMDRWYIGPTSGQLSLITLFISGQGSCGTPWSQVGLQNTAVKWFPQDDCIQAWARINGGW